MTAVLVRRHLRRKELVGRRRRKNLVAAEREFPPVEIADRRHHTRGPAPLPRDGLGLWCAAVNAFVVPAGHRALIPLPSFATEADGGHPGRREELLAKKGFV